MVRNVLVETRMAELELEMKVLGSILEGLADLHSRMVMQLRDTRRLWIEGVDGPASASHPAAAEHERPH